MAFSISWPLGGYGGASGLARGRVGGGGGFVCRSLSSVSATGRTSPWLMLPPAKEGGDVVYKFFSLAENRVLSFNWSHSDERYCSGFDPDDLSDDLVGSTHGWLVLKNYGDKNHLGLINPLTRRHIKLPSKDIPDSHCEIWTASQLIISCSPDEEEEEGECCALMAYGGVNRLAFCCPGRTPRWTRIGDNQFYNSFVYSKRQKLFFCARRGEQVMHLEAWDLRDPLYPKLTLNDTHLSLEKDCRPRSDFLVINEDTDDLFLVRRFFWVDHRRYYDDDDDDYGYKDKPYKTVAFDAYDDNEYKDNPYKTVAFDVYRYDPESRSMRYMDGGSLDGLSFFIGSNNGFALSAAEFPELKPNSIYFTDVLTSPPWADVNFGGHDIGIFNYEDATISPCYYPCDLPSCKRLFPSPRWFTPNTTTKAN